MIGIILYQLPNYIILGSWWYSSSLIDTLIEISTVKNYYLRNMDLYDGAYACWYNFPNFNFFIWIYCCIILWNHALMKAKFLTTISLIFLSSFVVQFVIFYMFKKQGWFHWENLPWIQNIDNTKMKSFFVTLIAKYNH